MTTHFKIGLETETSKQFGERSHSTKGSQEVVKATMRLKGRHIHPTPPLPQAHWGGERKHLGNKRDRDRDKMVKYKSKRAF